MVIPVVLCVSAAAAVAQETPAALRARAVSLAYDLDHEQALVLLRRGVALAPDDPAAHRALASVLWLNILFQRGAVTVDHYLGAFSRSDLDLKKPPADVDAEFRGEIAKAIALAEKRVAERPKDAQAHYDLGAAVGLDATYIATVEGRMLAGFKAARRAYDEHERVLELDPSRKDAGLIVGTYRYIVSTLSLPMRMLAYVAGFGGGRELGLQMIEGAASTSSDNHEDALFALVLMYNREHRYDDALEALQELHRLHPRNRLVLLESGSTALRAGRYGQAEGLLSEGLAMLDRDSRPRIPGELALWRYKRGAARAGEGRFDAALEDLHASVASEAPAWILGRAHVEIGRVALRRGDTARAGEEADRAAALCQSGHDPACIDSAKALRKARGR
jgi:tetratricopeptide (TPR) repeat protein